MTKELGTILETVAAEHVDKNFEPTSEALAAIVDEARKRFEAWRSRGTGTTTANDELAERLNKS